MGIFAALGGLALIFLILVEGFEAMILPRRVTRPYRMARLYYRSAWHLWNALAELRRTVKRHDASLSVFGPLSLLGLLALWVFGLVFAFALIHWGLGTQLNLPGGQTDFGTYFYLSGVTFFTLGYGDVVPLTLFGRVLTVVQAGMGFGFMAVVIGYLPVLYQAFSRREVLISLLDARAGSPPTAGQLLIRAAHAHDVAALEPLLAECERWSAELLESHLSFPVLSYYRSQHDNQSWLATLTAILDTCSLLLAVVKSANQYQTQLTFAMARHAAVDLAMTFQTPPQTPPSDRLPADRLAMLREQLRAANVTLREGEAADAKLAELRGLYEPFIQVLGAYFRLGVPPVCTDKPPVDNWQTSAWTRRAAGIGKLPIVDDGDDHYD